MIQSIPVWVLTAVRHLIIVTLVARVGGVRVDLSANRLVRVVIVMLIM